MSDQTIIAFTGIAGSGKDTLCTLLKNHLKGSVEILRFASPIKQITQILFPGLPHDAVHSHEGKGSIIPESQMTVRSCLQNVGGEILRAQDSNVWVTHLSNRIKKSTAKYILIPDLRYVNEAEMVYRLGGKIVWIWRAGLDTMNHPSESSICNWANEMAHVRIENKSLIGLVGYAQAVADYFQLEWDNAPLLCRVASIAFGDQEQHARKGDILEMLVEKLKLDRADLLITNNHLPDGQMDLLEERRKRVTERKNEKLRLQSAYNNLNVTPAVARKSEISPSLLEPAYVANVARKSEILPSLLEPAPRLLFPSLVISTEGEEVYATCEKAVDVEKARLASESSARQAKAIDELMKSQRALENPSSPEGISAILEEQNKPKPPKTAEEFCHPNVLRTI